MLGAKYNVLSYLKIYNHGILFYNLFFFLNSLVYTGPLNLSELVSFPSVMLVWLKTLLSLPLWESEIEYTSAQTRSAI